MKFKYWIYLALLLLCAIGFFGYRSWDSARTDIIPPEISFSVQLPELSVQDGEAGLLADVTATDDTDGDVTADVVVEKVRLNDQQGLVTVTYAAFDKAGNVSKRSRQVQYTDYQGPRFSLSAPLLFTSSFDLLRYISATDPLDGNISRRIRATSLDESSISQPGTHDVMLRVTNSLGHTVELVVPVEVGSFTGYSGRLTLTDYLVYLEQGSDFRAESYLESFTGGKTEFALNGAVPEGFTFQTSGTVDMDTPGVYAVTYELIQNGSSYAAVSRLIIVVEA